jgi:hypothetical protein
MATCIDRDLFCHVPTDYFKVTVGSMFDPISNCRYTLTEQLPPPPTTNRGYIPPSERHKVNPRLIAMSGGWAAMQQLKKQEVAQYRPEQTAGPVSTETSWMYQQKVAPEQAARYYRDMDQYRPDLLPVQQMQSKAEGIWGYGGGLHPLYQQRPYVPGTNRGYEAPAITGVHMAAASNGADGLTFAMPPLVSMPTLPRAESVDYRSLPFHEAQSDTLPLAPEIVRKPSQVLNVARPAERVHTQDRAVVTEQAVGRDRTTMKHDGVQATYIAPLSHMYADTEGAYVLTDEELKITLKTIAAETPLRPSGTDLPEDSLRLERVKAEQELRSGVLLRDPTASAVGHSGNKEVMYPQAPMARFTEPSQKVHVDGKQDSDIARFISGVDAPELLHAAAANRDQIRDRHLNNKVPVSFGPVHGDYASLGSSQPHNLSAFANVEEDKRCRRLQEQQTFPVPQLDLDLLLTSAAAAAPTTIEQEGQRRVNMDNVCEPNRMNYSAETVI